MTEKPLKHQTIDELYQSEEKARKNFIRNIFTVLFTVGISILITAENGFGFFTFLPFLFTYMLINSYLILTDIRAEIQSRILHLRERR